MFVISPPFQPVWPSPVRGAVSVAILMLYYVILLSTMVQIVRQRDASSIYLPLACAAVLNGGMWTIYGLVRPDLVTTMNIGVYSNGYYQY